MKAVEGLPQKWLGALATSCLVDEARLTPKPGLVDRRGGGSHSDMTFELMQRSALALQPCFERIADAAWGRGVSKDLRREVGRIGREGEAAMMQATGGVNTHRGAIWALGLLVAAAASKKMRATAPELFETAGALARIPDEALSGKGRPESHGERAKRLYRATGAREEAALGFPHVASAALPKLREGRAKGLGAEAQQLDALLLVMSTLSDTCVLSRAGVEGLRFMQEGARDVLRKGGSSSPEGKTALLGLDRRMQEMRISPGGAADLLAATLFADRFRNLD